MSTDHTPTTAAPAGADHTLSASPSTTVPFLVTGGGPPTDAERAAIATALAQVAAEAATEVAAHGHVPAWTRAALTEATRRVTITSPQELRR